MGKLSDMLATHREAKQRAEEAAATSEREQQTQRAYRRALLMKAAFASLVIALVAGATFALFHFVIWNRIPHQMAGTWLIPEGELKGATLEFLRNGTMVGIVNIDGKEGRIRGKIDVEEGKLHITTIHPVTFKEHTDTQTIQSLTDDEFVIVDKKGTVIRMERLR